MLKIKMIMAALLAIGFASQTFAGDDGAPPAKKAKTSAKTPGANATRKWTETGEALTEKCKSNCDKEPCKNKNTAVECATNCRKTAPLELVDCTPGAYAANCGAYASAESKAANAATAKTDEVCLTLAKANAAIMNKIYVNRDNKSSSQGGGKMTPDEAADESMAAFSREAKIWKMLKSIEVQ